MNCVCILGSVVVVSQMPKRSPECLSPGQSTIHRGTVWRRLSANDLFEPDQTDETEYSDRDKSDA